MNYDEYKQIVFEKIDKSIDYIVDNNKKILLKAILQKWFEEKYSEQIKNILLEKKYDQLIKISNEINYFLNITPEEQLLIIENNQDFITLKTISSEIFNKSISSLETNTFISEQEYNDYINRLNEIDKNNKDNGFFKNIISECLLDLEYLKNEGNVDIYSLRLGRFININKSI